MAKKKKNSNYVTPKTIAAKEAMEAAKRRLKIKKILIPSVIAFLILALIVGAVFAIGVPLGMLDYKPEATGHVSIEFEGYEDTMHIELYGNDAPKTVARFIEYYSELEGTPLRAFKDGLLYFGAEAADYGESGIEGEFSDNGVDNKIVMRKGVIALARGEDANSGKSQFFIATKNRTDLDGKYAAFAKIDTGMDLLKEIVENLETDDNGNIINAPKIKSISYHDAGSH